MKLVSFQIKCFKSIIDSGECILANDITILAGKNESGKTSVLEALNRFNFKDEAIPDDEIADGKKSDECAITLKVCYSQEKLMEKLDKVLADTADDDTEGEDTEGEDAEGEDDAEDVFVKAGISLNLMENVLSHFIGTFSESDEHEISFTVNCKGMMKIEGEVVEIIENAIQEEMHIAVRHCHTILERINEINQDLPVPFKDIDILDGPYLFSNYFTHFRSDPLEDLAQFCQDNGINTDEYRDKIEKIEEYLGMLEHMQESIAFARSFFRNMCPEIVFFSSFKDVLAFTRPVAEIENDALLLDFFKLAGIDQEQLLSYNMVNPDKGFQAKKYLMEKNATITNEFKRYWKQSDLNLEAEIGNGNLNINVSDKETGMLLKPEQRSDGFKWFLEFFIKLKAHETDKARIILIDEPGLYLHAKAQRDVLRVLENLTKEHNDQIIITSHSPYFIDTAKLNRVRLVEKHEKKGTEIENKLYADAESDARTPIITAIGLDLARNLTSLSDGSVLVEGISDYYYLSKFAELKGVKNLTFIPAVGAHKVATLASLHIGYGMSFVAVLDNDSEGKKAKKSLQKLDIKDERLIWVVEENDRSVEDLFSMDDFLKYVADGENFDINKYNSVSNLIKDKSNRLNDKVRLSKHFSENKNVAFKDLSNETQERVNRLFENIEAGFETEKAELQTKEETAPNSIPDPPAI